MGALEAFSCYYLFFRIFEKHLGKVDMLGVVKRDGDGLEQVDV